MKWLIAILTTLSSLILISSCTSIVRFSGNGAIYGGSGKSIYTPTESFDGERGYASFYGDEFEGRKTANGDYFSQDKLTAAHKTLGFGTKLLVKNLENGKTCVVTVNDRGPFVSGRIIDLSKAAAIELGMMKKGIVEVEIKLIK